MKTILMMMILTLSITAQAQVDPPCDEISQELITAELLEWKAAASYWQASDNGMYYESQLDIIRDIYTASGQNYLVEYVYITYRAALDEYWEGFVAAKWLDWQAAIAVVNQKRAEFNACLGGTAP